MAKFTNQLDNLKIASPCSANWDEMTGDNRVRFCGECKLNVYNLSGMSKVDAENLVANTNGRLCVRMYQRADGSVITQDCPVGWARIKQRTRLFVTATASIIFTFFSAIGLQAMFNKSNYLGMKNLFVTPTPEKLMGIMVKPSPKKSPKPKPSPSPSPKVLMGKPEIPPKDSEVKMGEMVVQRN